MSYLPSKLPELEPDSKPFAPDKQGFINWLETQDPNTTYRFWSSSDCVICRFAKATGHWKDGYAPTCHFLEAAGNGGVIQFLACEYNNKTYGELLSGLKAL
jgi:hypothetical protein